jgi:hypothetical protein
MRYMYVFQYYTHILVALLYSRYLVQVALDQAKSQGILPLVKPGKPKTKTLLYSLSLPSIPPASV